MSVPQPAPVRPEDLGEDGYAWRRMHPVTPLLKGWKTVAAILIIVSTQLTDDIRRSAHLLGGRGWLLALGGFGVIAVLAVAWAFVSWRVTRYAVTDEAVHLRQGIVFRQQRQARLDRLQAIDVVQPLLARHTVAATEGAVNASTDEFEILVTGRGGHGGYPHLTRDPVLALAQVVVALQQVVSRRVDPLHAAVLSIGALHAGSAANVIPDEAHAAGTLRLLDVGDRAAVHEEITAIVDRVAAGFGCRGDVRI